MIHQQNGHCFAADQQHFADVRAEMIEQLMGTQPIHTNMWQSMDTSEAGNAFDTHELLNVTLWYDMPEEQRSAERFIRPDMPWAEGHFQERVGGEPLNPGYWHAQWPYAGAGLAAHQKGGKYEHNYMERFWAKALRYDDELHNRSAAPTAYPFTGYRFAVGDLADVVEQLRRDPTTRQAYLPVWFPEDTGATAGQRVPCTLGYHFIIREGKLHLGYWIRSCDVRKHFTNDVYMAVRLGQWMRERVENDSTLMMGQLTMNIVSFHGFVGETELIWKMVD